MDKLQNAIKKKTKDVPMRSYTLIYLKYFDLPPHSDTFIACEICGKRSNDIHHLERRGMGGSKTKDHIENLMALCRDHHLMCEADPVFNETAKEIHKGFMEWR